jgi:hypothetical protein
LWKTSATRCDVFINARTTSKGLIFYICHAIMFVRPFFLLGASGKSANWSTWWIMDGGDDATQVRTWEMPLRSNLFMMLCELPM